MSFADVWFLKLGCIYCIALENIKIPVSNLFCNILLCFKSQNLLCKHLDKQRLFLRPSNESRAVFFCFSRYMGPYIELQLSDKCWHYTWSPYDKMKQFSMIHEVRIEVAYHMTFWLAHCHISFHCQIAADTSFLFFAEMHFDMTDLGNCSYRCGHYSFARVPLLKCQCDEACRWNDDCCQGYEEACGKTIKKESNSLSR